jgi:hypothetical protein
VELVPKPLAGRGVPKVRIGEAPEFAANAGVLESAERRLLIVKHAVDRDAAGLDLRRHAAGALNVGAAH